jgi:CHAD domain-containing protein
MLRTPCLRYCLYGAKMTRKRLRVLTRLCDGVRAAEDIEAIHKMRVATRRLRIALFLFEECNPKRRARRWRKEVRRLTRAFGAARDLDVQILFVEDFLETAVEPLHRPGIVRLLLRLRQERSRRQAQVVQALDRFAREDVAKDLRDNLVRTSRQTRVPADPSEQTIVLRHAQRHVTQLLRIMLRYERYVTHPERADELHQMRIAAKHLRYALETFAPLCKGRLNQSIRAARRVQDLLGALHDCDTWIATLPAFLEEERLRALDYFGTATPFEEIPPGIQYVIEDRRKTRAIIYQKFVRFWSRSRKRQIWDNLQTGLLAPSTTATLAVQGVSP